MYHQGMQTPSSGPPSPVPPVTERAAWKALAAHAETMRERHLRDLFAGDPSRGTRLAVEAAGIYFDYSKHRVVDETMALLVRLAEESGLRSRIDAMFRGDRINVTEGRAVLHVALRAPAGRVDPRGRRERRPGRARGARPDGRVRRSRCVPASGPATPAPDPRRREHRHRRFGSRPRDGLRGAAGSTATATSSSGSSRTSTAPICSKPFATSTRPRRCSSSRRRRSPRSRR